MEHRTRKMDFHSITRCLPPPRLSLWSKNCLSFCATACPVLITMSPSAFLYFFFPAVVLAKASQRSFRLPSYCSSRASSFFPCLPAVVWCLGVFVLFFFCLPNIALVPRCCCCCFSCVLPSVLLLILLLIVCFFLFLCLPTIVLVPRRFLLLFFYFFFFSSSSSSVFLM